MLVGLPSPCRPRGDTIRPDLLNAVGYFSRIKSGTWGPQRRPAQAPESRGFLSSALFQGRRKCETEGALLWLLAVCGL